MAPAIQVEGLGKKYVLRHQGQRQAEKYVALRDVIANGARSAMRAMSGKTEILEYAEEEFWALRDVGFVVEPGEVVGIIGRNGAGKSTLLKLLSRITEPTEGRIVLRGRVASLLEVGTGFHAELTGRENIYLNGAILGMSQSEVRRKFDEIVAFAEVDRFLDTPVKRYSSGMYVRLAFAVAAHLEPEILVVDEVLAVGDAQFQRKCLGKMGEVSRTQGRTVLFVSHNMQAVSTLTTRAVVLSGGSVSFDGPTGQGIAVYLDQMKQSESVYTAEADDAQPRVTRAEIATSHPNGVHAQGEAAEARFEISTPHPIGGAAFSFQIVNGMDQPVLHVLTMDSEIPMCREAGVYTLVCRIPKLRLYIGSYHLRVHFAERVGGKKFDTLDRVCAFSVEVHGEMRDFYWTQGAAAYVEETIWNVEKAE